MEKKIKIEPLRRKDYYKHIKQAKNYFEWRKWVDSLRDYEKYLWEKQKNLSEHFKSVVTVKEYMLL